MTTSTRVMMALMILVIVTLVSDVTATCQQGKTSQRASAANRSKNVQELIHAAAAGDISKVRQLLNAGVNINGTFARDDSELSGKTALMVASSHGYSAMVVELIKRGANVNQKHFSGEMALMFAADSGNENSIKALLGAGADPNAKVGTAHAGELTPLSITINTDHPRRYEVARILLAAKAEVNPKGAFLCRR